MNQDPEPELTDADEEPDDSTAEVPEVQDDKVEGEDN